MAYLQLPDESNAEGLLATIYKQSRERAGRVYQIVRCSSLAPKQLMASLSLYRETMHAESPLTRAQEALRCSPIWGSGTRSAAEC